MQSQPMNAKFFEQRAMLPFVSRMAVVCPEIVDKKHVIPVALQPPAAGSLMVLAQHQKSPLELKPTGSEQFTKADTAGLIEGSGHGTELTSRRYPFLGVLMPLLGVHTIAVLVDVDVDVTVRASTCVDTAGRSTKDTSARATSTRIMSPFPASVALKTGAVPVDVPVTVPVEAAPASGSKIPKSPSQAERQSAKEIASKHFSMFIPSFLGIVSQTANVVSRCLFCNLT